MWRNSLEHFLGNHSFCDHEASEKELLITAPERTHIQAAADLLEET
jgi:hypothetical protein